MRIGIDAHMIGEQETGNETYIKTVLEGFSELDAPHKITAFLQKAGAAPYVPPSGIDFVDTTPSNALQRLALYLPRKAHQLNLDLLFVTYVAPLVLSCPYVVAVHDISFIHFPDFFPRSVRWMLETMLPPSMRQAAHIVTLSEQSRQDIIDHYRIDPAKITVTYAAIESRFRPLIDIALPAALASDKPYILAVGNIQPRKNIVRLMKAYTKLRQQGHIDHQLVLVGQALWFSDEVKAAAHGLESDIRFTGYVDNNMLVALYNHADLFVYPSLYEGFGLPPIEAMACGTPVITSNISALPEAVGDAAIMVDPYDVDALADAMLRVLRNTRLQQQLRQKGLARAAQFTPRHLAERLLPVFEGASR